MKSIAINVFKFLIGLIFPVDPKDTEIEETLSTHSVEQISAMIPSAPMPLRGIIGSGNETGAHHVHAAWQYRSPLSHALIWRLKYGRDRRAADCAGYALSAYIEKYIEKNARGSEHFILIPIPLSKQRRRERGYNQSEWICEVIVQHSNFSLRTDILLRSEHRERQTFKDRSSRIKNAQDIFFVKNIPEHLQQSATILIIDDVVTTGSTFFAAQQTLLKTAPDLRIICLAVAH